MMGDLAAIVAFNEARLAKWEAAAKAALGAGGAGGWRAGHRAEMIDGAQFAAFDSHEVRAAAIDGGVIHHIVLHDPASVLRQVAAIRRIMARHRDQGDQCIGCGPPISDYGPGDCPELRDIAAIWDAHPDYQAAR